VLIIELPRISTSCTPTTQSWRKRRL